MKYLKLTSFLTLLVLLIATQKSHGQDRDKTIRLLEKMLKNRMHIFPDTKSELNQDYWARNTVSLVKITEKELIFQRRFCKGIDIDDAFEYSIPVKYAKINAAGIFYTGEPVIKCELLESNGFVRRSSFGSVRNISSTEDIFYVDLSKGYKFQLELQRLMEHLAAFSSNED
ncbi:hypothetical protein FEDK69T_02450 [Flavobacterium enshiense DK69]|uniref:Uncharacterized protein n=1 Tax=Flavobacterium enshiense DK69 TaxID=1107311 RepID=V6SKX6_9FLAO|nr:hypothetical protein [Flavobacterium enshiense]ESU25055.1 hypothetical protein FEDK69T_02450 [Flavobacterium enshiense DK69]KGO96845.1 hypothetical protein Q767_03860 [Flavobacterium enshiense DK69]